MAWPQRREGKCSTVETSRVDRPGGLEAERAGGGARVRAAACRIAGDEPEFHAWRHRPPEASEWRAGHDAVLPHPRGDHLVPFDQRRGIRCERAVRVSA